MRGPLALQLEKTAALFIDLQEEHRRDQRYLVEGFDAVLANVAALQRAARAAGVPCFHAAYVVDMAAGRQDPFHPVNADGTSAFSAHASPLTAICPEVAPAEDEEVLVKSQASAFAGGKGLESLALPMSLSARSGGRTATRSDEGARRVSDGKGEVPSAQQALEQVLPKWAPGRHKQHDQPIEFHGALAPRLRARGIEWLLVAGVWTEACVAATVRDALGLGFRVLLVKDACGSGSIAMHQTGILNLANRLYGGAVIDTDRACRLLAGETVEAWMVQGSVPLRFTYGNAAGLYERL